MFRKKDTDVRNQKLVDTNTACEKLDAVSQTDKKSNKEPKTPQEKRKEACSSILYIAIVVAVTIFVITFIGQRTRVDGDSMYPSLHDGDNLIVEKISYRFQDPERFDVIIFPYQDTNKYFIKRIIGLPGETIQIDYEGNIYIDGEVLEEDYGYETIVYPGIAEEPITLADDEYFVLGDNRNDSMDSRFESVGLIKKDAIIGRAWVRFFPFKDACLVANIDE